MANQNADSTSVRDPAARSGLDKAARSVAAGSAASYPVDPDSLMVEISRSVMGRMLVISMLIHFVLIGGTSVGYISDCFQYRTLDPKTKKAEIAKKETEDKAADDEKKKVEEAKKKLAEGEKKKGTGGEKKEPGKTAPAGEKVVDPATTETTGAAGETKEPEKTKSAIEKKVEETSKERPTQPSVNLDSPDSL